MLSRTAVLAAVLALAASASWAQDPRFEIGANAGWTLSDGVTGGPILAGDGNLYNSIDPEDSMSWGADIGFFVNENTSIGFLFSQQKSKMIIGGAAEREVGDWSVNNYHGVATYHFGDSDATARPYVFGGAGMTQYGEVDFIARGRRAALDRRREPVLHHLGRGREDLPVADGGPEAGRALDARPTSSPTPTAGGAIPTGAATSWATPSTRTSSSSRGGLSLRF